MQISNGWIDIQFRTLDLQCSTAVVVLNTAGSGQSDVALISEVQTMTMNENATVFSFIKVPLETYTVSGFPGTMGRIECPALLYEPVNFSFFVDAIPPQPA